MPAGDTFVKLPDGGAGVLARLKLAEMALYRVQAALDDMKIEIQRREAGRSGPLSAEGARKMIGRVMADYADPILPGIREAIGYTGPGGGWYLGLEEARAKLIGAARAEDRLAREGLPSRAVMLSDPQIMSPMAEVVREGAAREIMSDEHRALVQGEVAERCATTINGARCSLIRGHVQPCDPTYREIAPASAVHEPEHVAFRVDAPPDLRRRDAEHRQCRERLDLLR